MLDQRPPRFDPDGAPRAAGSFQSLRERRRPPMRPWATGPSRLPARLWWQGSGSERSAKSGRTMLWRRLGGPLDEGQPVREIETMATESAARIAQSGTRDRSMLKGVRRSATQQHELNSTISETQSIDARQPPS